MSIKLIIYNYQITINSELMMKNHKPNTEKKQIEVEQQTIEQ